MRKDYSEYVPSEQEQYQLRRRGNEYIDFEYFNNRVRFNAERKTLDIQVDAYPLCLRTKDTEEIIQTIKILAGSFGGINLEDISAPRCFEIEARLKQELDIPVFHDDQHGTAIVMAAALINALKLAGKKIDEIRLVVNGAGAAGTAIAKFLMAFGVQNIVVCDRIGIRFQKAA